MSLIGSIARVVRRSRDRLWGYRVRHLGIGSLGEGVVIERPLGGLSGPGSISIGDGVHIGMNARLLTYPENEGGANGRLVIGERTVILGDVDLGAARLVEIGHDALLGARVTIRDADHGFRELDVHRVDQPLAVAPVVIGPFVWVGQGAIILKGVEVGEGAVIGAGSVVTHSVGAGEVVAGNPARRIGWASGSGPSA